MTAETPDFRPEFTISGQKFVLGPSIHSFGLTYEDGDDFVLEVVQSPGTGEWIASALIGSVYYSVRYPEPDMAVAFLQDLIWDIPLPERYNAEPGV